MLYDFIQVSPLELVIGLKITDVAIKATTVRAAVARFPENSNLVAHR